MSEKRFKEGINFSCVDIETETTYWYACNLCGLLNELSEENEQLRKDKKTRKRYTNTRSRRTRLRPEPVYKKRKK